MVKWILNKIVGSQNQRQVKKLWPLVGRVNEIEEQYQGLSDSELQAKTAEFRQRLEQGETVDDLLPEAFATVKNTCRRLMGQEWVVRGKPYKWDMIPFDVQVLGAIALHRGMIAEVPHPTIGTLRLAGLPIKYSETPGGIRLHPPLLGEHTREVLTQVLRYPPDKIEALQRQGVISSG